MRQPRDALNPMFSHTGFEKQAACRIGAICGEFPVRVAFCQTRVRIGVSFDHDGKIERGYRLPGKSGQAFAARVQATISGFKERSVGEVRNFDPNPARFFCNRDARPECGV